MVRQILPNIYAIQIRLVGSPLKNLNSYVIKGKKRNLLIDTGFNQKECFEDINQGIRELDLDMNKTDIFLTHFHADHTGLAAEISTPNSKIYMGEVDIPFLYAEQKQGSSFWDELRRMFLLAGYPEDEFNKSVEVNPAKIFAAPKKIDCVPVKDGDVISVDTTELRCIVTSGHTPGHICLYAEKDKVMFLGDHVLFDITPNIPIRFLKTNPLKDYLDNLEKIKSFDVEKPLPAHRRSGASLAKRVDELKQHHKDRLAEIQNIIAANPGISCYDVAARMHWSIRAKNWEEFPSAQKWFAVSEASAHLNYLVLDGCVNIELINGINRYTEK